MIRLLTRLFIKNSENTSDSAVRSAYGVVCSVVGIALNVLLFAGKYAAGALSGSIAITADAFNNLSDAGSSVVTLIGFRFAGMKPDREHPFGHGRIEYIAGFIVSVMILIMGFELGKSSFARVLSPEPVDSGLVPLLVLTASIAVKLYMYAYNRAVSGKISSPAMLAAARDSLSDCVSTAVVLGSSLLARFTGIQADGWCGLLVAAFILWGGCVSAKDTLSPLLGNPPSRELVERIESIVLSEGTITGIHDLIVHDYGPGRVMISLHGEVPAEGDLIAMHDAVDLIERRLREELGCEAVIHMDPVSANDERVMQLRERVAREARKADPSLTIHDFRIVEGPTHTNVVFDVVVPPECGLTDKQVLRELELIVSSCGENYCAVITVDHAYIL